MAIYTIARYRVRSGGVHAVQSAAVKKFEAAHRPELDGGDVVFTDYRTVATNRS
jgi:hypothetical protein